MSDDFTPYAPPGSSLAGAPELGITERSTVDIGEAFNFVFKDPDWIMRCLIMGLAGMFIPLLGAFSLMGWQRRIFEAVRAGAKPGLPELDIVGDMGRGVPVFVALITTMFPLTIVMVLGMAVVVVPFAAAMESGGQMGDVASVLLTVMMLGLYAMQMLIALGLNFVMPEIYRRGLRGEMVPLLTVGESLRDIRRSIGPFFIAFLGWFIASFVASFGMFACLVGIFVTMPMSVAIQGHIAAQWEQVVRGARAAELV